MKKLKVISLTAIGVFAVIWLSSLLRCAVLTHIYKNDFKYAHTANTMLGETEQFHVLSCKGGYAEVYYIGKGKSSGDLLAFKKINGKWSEVSWDTVWSGSGGSASGVVWPYWWHFIYGGL